MQSSAKQPHSKLQSSNCGVTTTGSVHYPEALAAKVSFVNSDSKCTADNPTWTSLAILRSVSLRLTAYRAVLTSVLLLSITTRSMSLVGRYSPAAKHYDPLLMKQPRRLDP